MKSKNEEIREAIYEFRQSYGEWSAGLEKNEPKYNRMAKAQQKLYDLEVLPSAVQRIREEVGFEVDHGEFRRKK